MHKEVLRVSPLLMWLPLLPLLHLRSWSCEAPRIVALERVNAQMMRLWVQ